MVTCTNCDTKNSLDGKFCKSCGKALEIEAIEKAHAGLEDLVAQGFRSLNDGQVEEASLIAETALGEDPTCTSALSLKAMCCEREGRIAEALDLYERVVFLKPDSALDRIKVTHLRSTIAGKLAVSSPPPDRRTAFIGAIAATVLVISIGVAIAGFMNRGTDAAKTDSQSRTVPASKPDANGPADAQAQPQNQATPQNPANTQTPGVANPPPGGPTGDTNRPPVINAGDGRIPNFDGNTPIILKPNEDDINRGSRGGNGTRTQNPPTRGNNDPENDPPTLPNDSGKSGLTPKNSGIIDIRISNPQSGAGGASNLPDEKQAETLIRTGLQQYQAGRYANSARSFEGALKAGADPGRTNQRLAQAYDKLGQTADAIAAYTRAIASLEAQVKSGKGGAGAQASLESCKAALQVLKGGS